MLLIESTIPRKTDPRVFVNFFECKMMLIAVEIKNWKILSQVSKSSHAEVFLRNIQIQKFFKKNSIFFQEYLIFFFLNI